ncbi:respiratory nitrate reductase subunit gamma [Desulfoluna limicola]|nr:respiratory nitrate reductase subunit gamma [Desulfoluna limicola]
MYDFIRGPMVWISIAIFFGGIIWQVFRFLALSSTVDEPKLKRPAGLAKEEPPAGAGGLLYALKLSIFKTSPGMIIVTSVFHLCLIVVPLFLLGHNILIERAIGFSLFSFSEKTSDTLTVIFLLCGLFFLYRRLFVERVRIITSGTDYLMLLLATAPFITGFLAYHQLFDYKLMIVLHILAGEAMLILAPFTKFVHMVFFFAVRFTVKGEWALGSGNRNW